MDQTKIGQFIAACRKEQGLTQEQLAEHLGVSKNAVSKWERGLNLPDVSLMQPLCARLEITLNELFIGEAIPEERFHAVADSNLLQALQQSSFTAQERLCFFQAKWKKEHRGTIALAVLLWLGTVLLLGRQQVESYVIGAVAGLLGVLLYVVLYNRMMIYAEHKAFPHPEE